ncbi:hypothetical protein CARUB_v10016020mg [Capsella rubella]|uniref:Serine/threonine-protein kinase BSK n=1 Tax=Capsella rubella TaxID=81985 RepID=R0GAH9_9BRAS|nr:hypothetical protein CARUB_v10016020mg [Capsella rubella]
MGGCCTSTPLEYDPAPEEPQTQNDERKNEQIKKEGFSKWPFTGILSENLGFVAIKKFKNTPWDDPDYLMVSAKRIGELKHKRLVKLLGYCFHEDEGERLLVSELMPNDTLAKRLFHQKDMEWSMRVRVACHIAEVLDYCKTARCYSYDNLTANSVLFDMNGEACLSSFGLVRAIISYNRREEGNVETGNVPYRFGVILVNLLTGMQISPSQASELINGKSITELIDPNLKGEYSKQEATIVLTLASECLKCDNDDASFIPKDVFSMLEALQAKNEVPSSEMPKPQEEEASSSSQPQQLAP